MDKINEIQGERGLFKIAKIKALYEIGYTEKLTYIRNLDNNKVAVRKDKK